MPGAKLDGYRSTWTGCFIRFKLKIDDFMFTVDSTALRCGSFSEKISENHDDKNYCYFCKSNIPVINLIVGSRNLIKLPKNMSL